MQKIHLIKNTFLYIALIVGSVFLFTGSPELNATRSLYYIWDLGHILLFAVFSFIMLKDVQPVKRQGFWSQAVIIFILTVIIGVLIEFIQSKFDRSPDINDVVRNLIGSSIPLVFFNRRCQDLPRIISVSLKILVVIVLVRDTLPLGRSLIDEAIAQNQFPVLADFETPFETDRWHEKWRIAVDDRIARNGSHGLKVKLYPEKYSGISLKYFPSDWNEYQYLKFSIYNPDSDTLRIICRIHDSKHNNAYSDRFNQAFAIGPGWNDLSIPIDQIKSAPRTREMDIHHLSNIRLFIVDLKEIRIIYIDFIRLTA